MTSDNNNNSSTKNKGFKEIEIEQKDLLNVFFDKSHSQFESQLFLSRKRMLNAENGQNELSELLKSKLKALDMMLFILTNNKNILKDSDLSCCEVLNNLLCVSKKDKSYGEHIYSKIKSVILYIIKNQLSLKEKNNETIKVILKFLITLFNIKFDNGYFKQALDIISTNQEICNIFIKELFDKLFKGRNITIKLKEMKFILKSLLLEEKIIKFKKFFDFLEIILSYAHEKENGGSRTSFQLNQVVFLLQYLIEILNLKEINQNLPENNEKIKKLSKFLNDFKGSVKEFVDKNDNMEEKKMNKKEIEAKKEKIKRKKMFFGEMYNFLNKLKKYFKNEFEDKEINKIVGEINDLYKNTITVKYTVVINMNNDKKNKKEKKELKNKEKEKENEDNKNNEDNQKDNIDNEKEKEEKEDDNNKEENNNEEDSDKNDNEENNNDGIELNEDDEEEKINDKEQKKKNKEKKKNKDNKEEKINESDKKKKKQKNNDSKKVNKNKKKKEH